MSIEIKYFKYHEFLPEYEWKSLITNYLDLIYKTNIGEKLLNSINAYINKGYRISILNYSKNKNFQYPYCCKISEKNINIFIPDSPYFIYVPTFNKELIDGFDIEENYIENLLKGKPLSKKLEDSFVSSFSIYKFQPVVVILFHELVHCLRMLMNINSNFEEESTIYGLINDTINIDNTFIVENNFRKELNLGIRLSDDSKIYYIDGSNINNKFSTEYVKSLFDRLII